jgi:hypothetical protein
MVSLKEMQHPLFLSVTALTEQKLLNCPQGVGRGIISPSLFDVFADGGF